MARVTDTQCAVAGGWEGITWGTRCKNRAKFVASQAGPDQQLYSFGICAAHNRGAWLRNSEVVRLSRRAFIEKALEGCTIIPNAPQWASYLTEHDKVKKEQRERRNDGTQA